MKKIITAAIGLALASAPLLALADDSSGASAAVGTENSSRLEQTRQEAEAAQQARQTELEQKRQEASTTMEQRQQDRQTAMEQNQEDRLTQAKDRAEQEIERRIQSLTRLSTRIEDAKRIGETDKGDLSATLSAQISSLSTLKTQIVSDSSTTTLRTAIQSITKSYRIYALVVPQSAITAAASRVNAVAEQMTTFAAKIQDRISASGTANADATAALSDMQAKIADAKAQAAAAVSAVSGLTPDNGDATIAASNKAALESAHAKIKAAQEDLTAARKDVATALKALGVTIKENATSTSSTNYGASALTAFLHFLGK